MEHKHPVFDTDTHFTIDPITRQIKNASHRKTTLMQFDHNSERFTFECPRYIEAHDMAECNRVEVHYLNIDGNRQNSGVYTVDDLQVMDGDETQVTCSWVISSNATQLAGQLAFLLRFLCVDGDIITYSWNTDMFTAQKISKGIDAAGAFETEYVDVIEKWKASVMTYFAGDLKAWKDKTVAEIHEDVTADIASLADYVTPQLYGAIGDGTHDDTSALQAALDSGKTLFFPRGTYLFTDSLNLHERANMAINAENATLRYTGNDFAVVVCGVQEMTFHIGQIDAPNGSGIKFQCGGDDEYTQYVDVFFRAIKAKYYGVYADITGGWVNEVRFHNGVFTGCECGCYLNPTADDECTGWKFFNVSFEGSATGLYLSGNGCRFRDIELENIRYGDNTDMVVVHVANQAHNIKINASMPFYDSYFVINDGVTLYNSEINAPIYDAGHKLVCRQRYYDALGVAHDVGFIKRTTQELFNDCVHASVTKHANVTLSDPYCAYNAVMSTFQTKVVCNIEVGAWATIVTLPKEAMRVTGGCVHTYVPALNNFVRLYVNTDGTITSEKTLPSGAEFVINFTAIRNQ